MDHHECRDFVPRSRSYLLADSDVNDLNWMAGSCGWSRSRFLRFLIRWAARHFHLITDMEDHNPSGEGND